MLFAWSLLWMTQPWTVLNAFASIDYFGMDTKHEAATEQAYR